PLLRREYLSPVCLRAQSPRRRSEHGVCGGSLSPWPDPIPLPFLCTIVHSNLTYLAEPDCLAVNLSDYAIVDDGGEMLNLAQSKHQPQAELRLARIAESALHRAIKVEQEAGRLRMLRIGAIGEVESVHDGL